MADPKRDPDYLLAAENDKSLNETFYRARPYAYFNQRLESLLLVAGKSEELAELLAEGVTVGKLTAGGVPVRTDLPEQERAEVREDRERFVIAEAEVLLHHAAETLLRLYLAHEDLPPSPWLALAGERHVAAFKAKVAELGEELGDEQRQGKLAAVFFGSVDRTDLQPTPDEETWNVGLRNVATWLAWYAAHFLDAGVYNAAKHGLAVQAGESAFQFGDDDLISRSGPSLAYIEMREDARKRRRWRQTTQWLDLDRWLAYIFMACRLMKGLMNVGRARYTGAGLTHLDALGIPAFEQTVAGGIQFDKLSMDLLYYAEPALRETEDDEPADGPKDEG
ncbi:MAG TPA: hypothetical protein VES79_11805 [Solirubrobacteraceae bacterium]|nr:hypothetical protein [Solirubrobacteraceae bacterium]